MDGRHSKLPWRHHGDPKAFAIADAAGCAVAYFTAYPNFAEPFDAVQAKRLGNIALTLKAVNHFEAVARAAAIALPVLDEAAAVGPLQTRAIHAALVVRDALTAAEANGPAADPVRKALEDFLAATNDGRQPCELKFAEAARAALAT